MQPIFVYLLCFCTYLIAGCDPAPSCPPPSREFMLSTGAKVCFALCPGETNAWCAPGYRATEDAGAVLVGDASMDVHDALADSSTIQTMDVDATDANATCSSDGGTSCAGHCVELTTDWMNCGRCGNVCPLPMNSPRGMAASCNLGICDLRCADGWEPTAMGACDVKLPRAIAPLSTARVTSRRPRLRWVLPEGVSSAHVEICRDRFCFVLLAEGDAATEWSPANELPPGPVLWRLRGVIGAQRSSRTSPRWSAWIPGRSTAGEVQTSWGHYPDVNGDGLGDVVVSEVVANCPGVDCRSLRLNAFLGDEGRVENGGSPVISDGPAGMVMWTFLGHHVGDINGDGSTDAIFGSPLAREMLGSVDVFHSSRSGILQPARAIVGSVADSFFGFGAVGIDDVNGDGFGDVAIGAFGEAAGGLRFAGAVRLYYGGPTGLSQNPITTLRGEENSYLGLSGVAAGDFNADGYSDIAISSVSLPGAMPRRRSEVWVYHGSPRGIAAAPSVVLRSSNATDSFGIRTGVGDFNGDGYADLWAGNQDQNFAVANVNPSVLFFAGGPGGLSAIAQNTLTDGSVGMGRFGERAAVGDINLDGFDDWITTSQPAMQPTRVISFLGSVTSVQMASAQTISAPGMGMNRDDLSFNAIGDHDGDGLLDFARHQSVLANMTRRDEISVLRTLPAGAGISNVVSGSFLFREGADNVRIIEN